ncbi:MAG: hypothetical protein A2020_06245 [Lentisphaerae bacterium GWF2_45_14]|nr:MAG: hypothetical protein A2020_06245 [Lentisphaerae bacterium GWF2_45_14]
MASSIVKINVLTNNDCPNSRAFNCPLLSAKRHFSERKRKLHFIFGPPEKALECDVLFINSKVFRYDWRKGKNKIIDFLESARRKGVKTVWFDATDSTWCTQFEALEHVDLFLKSQILKDKTLYLKPFRTGRIFTDYFDELYKCGEESVSYPVPREEDLKKLDVSWNSCFENYNSSRYGFAAKMKQKLRPYLANLLGEKLSIAFTPAAKERTISVSCRVGLGHSRPSVIAHRKSVTEKMTSFGAESGKIPLDRYFEEMRNSKIAAGPFGVGEITLRDFEIIICGALLFKPEMDHMETWPDLFQPGKTFIQHKWDLSDLDEAFEEILKNDSMRIETASEAQKVYADAVSEEGMEKFAVRLIEKISRI